METVSDSSRYFVLRIQDDNGAQTVAKPSICFHNRAEIHHYFLRLNLAKLLSIVVLDDLVCFCVY